MAKRNDSSDPSQVNMIAADTVVEGSIRAQGDIRISGTLKGELHVEGRVMIADGGLVDGEVVAANADVAGRIEGNLQVRERLILRGTAHVDGHVRTGRLVIEEGAVFGGTCEMGSIAAEPAPEATPLKAVALEA